MRNRVPNIVLPALYGVAIFVGLFRLGAGGLAGTILAAAWRT